MLTTNAYLRILTTSFHKMYPIAQEYAYYARWRGIVLFMLDTVENIAFIATNNIFSDILVRNLELVSTRSLT